MIFKMAAKDFQLISKYIDKHGDGSILTFCCLRDTHMEISLSTNLGEEVILRVKSEDLNSFVEITKTRRLGDEL